MVWTLYARRCESDAAFRCIQVRHSGVEACLHLISACGFATVLDPEASVRRSRHALDTHWRTACPVTSSVRRWPPEVSSLIYFFAEQLEIGEYMGAGKPSYRRIRAALSSRYGYWYILFWSFFPGAPTDLVCLLAGAMRLSFTRFILAVTLGQGTIYSAYVYGASMFLVEAS